MDEQQVFRHDLMTKVCARCGKFRPVTQFRRDGFHAGRPSRRAVCTICEVEGRQPQQWLQKARDTFKHHGRAFIAQGWIASLEQMGPVLNWHVERIARYLEHAFAGLCPGCDEPFASMASGRAALTVDVCDPRRPPVWSLNTRFVCSTCNKEKHQAEPLKVAQLEHAKTVDAVLPGQLALFAAS